MRFDIHNRITGKVQFTADIDCDENKNASIKLGLAVMCAVKAGADLWGADLRYAYLGDADLMWANLRGADLGGANFRTAYIWGADFMGADLEDANLCGVHGLNPYVKSIQIDTYPITYTADVIQIECECHSHQEWAEFNDKRIMRMDGRRGLIWWREYKAWLFKTIEMFPAQPTGVVADGATTAGENGERTSQHLAVNGEA